MNIITLKLFYGQITPEKKTERIEIDILDPFRFLEIIFIILTGKPSPALPQAAYCPIHTRKAYDLLK